MKEIFYKYNFLYVVLLIVSVIFIGTGYFVYQQKGCLDTSPLIAFLNVGQGDAIYIRASNGKTLLIDTGPKDGGVISEIQKVTRCKDIHIDELLLTHPDADHIGEAGRLISKGLVDEVLHNGFLDIDQGDETLLENNLEMIAIQKRKVLAGDVLDFSELYIDVLYPIGEAYVYAGKRPKKIDDNDFSLVMKVTIKLQNGEKTFLLTGDASQKVEQQIISKNCIVSSTSCNALKSDILKLGHHGSKNSSASNFLEKVAPTEVVVSAGKNNKFHHPNEETIQRVRAQEIKSKMPLKIRETFAEGNIIYR